MTPSDMGMIARTIKKILRLDDPYDTYLQKEGYWEDILSPDNEGWIPLSVVKMCLQSKMDHVNLPFESNDFLVPFLTNHDNLSRFELGKCDCPNSRFRNQQCARAVYAHMSLNLHIYRYIICKPPHRLQSHTPSPDVPHYAWFLCEHERVKAFMKREHYALYGIPFVQCMSTESVWDCWNYKVTTSQAEQLDEKLYSSKVYFVEVDLHSIVQDANIDIYRRQNLNSSNYFWYIFPKYFVEEGGLTVEEGDDSDGKEAETQTKVLPQHHLTGRFAILGDDKCKEGAIRVFKNTISDDDFMQCHLYREEAAMSDISRARGTPYEFSNWKEEDGDAAQTNTVMYTFALDAATRRDLLEGRVNTTSLAVVDGPLDASTEIDTDGIKSEIKKFLADAERVVLQISVPLKDTNGNNIKNRSEAIKKIKEWAEGQDLVWRRSGTSADETVPERSESNSYFEVQKRSGWTKTELLTVVEEIGLPEMKSHLDRIKEAVTRHCENSQENYETMEFVGDAVLDLIAVVDTFLANFLFKCKVEKSVVTDLLNNDVLGHLLPRSVDTHLEKMYGASIQWKTKADMLEALIGAAYYSKIGLDSIRKLLFNRFALLGDNVGGPHHLDSTTGELKEVLQVARKRCVYTKVRYEDLEQHHQFKCFQVIEIPLCEKYFPEDDNSRKNFSTHRAAVRLPRVQAKQYATHFTTGPMYSYRRVPSLDTPVLLNRILSQHKTGEVAYINEVILPRTHVVVDFDGKDIRSHDILRYFRDWYTHKFGCDAAMLIVDCTGLSVVTKKMKHSCHVHFPQITVNLERLEAIQCDLRQYITAAMRNIHGRASRMLEGRPEGLVPRQQVFFSSRFVSRVVRERRWQPKRGMWGFCSVEDLLEASKTCRLWYQSVFEHMASLCQEGPDELVRLFQVPEKNVFVGPVGRQQGGHWVVFKEGEETYLLPDEWCKPHKEGQKVLGYKVDLTDTDDKKYYAESTWAEVIDSSLVMSKKLRMYLCDKCDTVYGEERRTLVLDTVSFPSRDVRVRRPYRYVPENELLQRKRMAAVQIEKDLKKASRDDTNDGDLWSEGELQKEVDPEEGEYPVQVAHSSTLRMTSLRTPEFRDVSGAVHYGWTDKQPDKDTDCAEIDPAGTDDTLPSFSALFAGAASPEYYIAADDAAVWSGSMLLPERGMVVTEKTKATASLPSWWAPDPRTRETSFYIAGEKVFSLPGAHDLYDGVSSPDGFARLMRLFTPHIDGKGCAIYREYCSAYGGELLPMFVPFRRKEVNQVPRQRRPVTEKGMQPSKEKVAPVIRKMEFRALPTLSGDPLTVDRWEKTLSGVMLLHPYSEWPLVLYHRPTEESAIPFQHYKLAFDLQSVSANDALLRNALAFLNYSSVYIFNTSKDDESCLRLCQALLPVLERANKPLVFSSERVLQHLSG
uniref:Dicer 1 n=2 Tax=Angomonas deanei TaxID=59799 RepID=A0A1B2LUL4_9TRYP|nr:dicer 1 [Angomonas deanei]